MNSELQDTGPRYGLPPSLWIPTAATSLEALELFVGGIQQQRLSSTGRVNALLIAPHRLKIADDDRVPLWSAPQRATFVERLHPQKQVWVHVDYSGYRRAYLDFGMAPLPANYVLDHIQNREAIRLRDISHPYLRLCPVFQQVNTSGGHESGGEGLEKDFVRNILQSDSTTMSEFRKVISHPIVYADPFDLTKMLDIAPGTQVLEGVRETQALFLSRKRGFSEDLTNPP